jgi:hypothetical protein
MATLTLHGSMEAIIKAVLAAYPGVVIDDPVDGGYSADSDYTTRKIVVDGKEDIGEERGGRS